MKKVSITNWHEVENRKLGYVLGYACIPNAYPLVRACRYKQLKLF